MKEFKDIKEIFSFLNLNKNLINARKARELWDVVIPVFASPLTDNPKVMQQVHRWFDLDTNITNFSDVVRFNVDKLMDTPLSLYKFKILCQYRGPLNDEDFFESIIKKINDDKTCEIAKHPDFPMSIKEHFYKATGDVEYLPQDAQDIFVF